MRTYKTPEEAARGDIPARYIETLATAVASNGETAVVLQLTNENGVTEPYQVVCHLCSEGWRGGSGSDGSGWTRLGGRDAGEAMGVTTLWEDTPDGVVEVSVRWRDEDYRVAVENGYFLFVRWNTSAADAFEAPYVVAYTHSDGRSVKMPRDTHGAEERYERVQRMLRRTRTKGQTIDIAISDPEELTEDQT